MVWVSMWRILKHLSILFCLLIFLLSCSHKPDPIPSWEYDAKSIEIRYTADKLLNAFDNKPHTLLLAVYQMNNVNTFEKWSKYEDGLKKLLEVQGTDPSFVAAQKFFVEPGESKTLVLNRTENAKWVGIVAGYYNLAPDKVTKVFKIPVKVETKGLIRRKRVAEIQPLRVYLILGPHSIQEKKTK